MSVSSPTASKRLSRPILRLFPPARSTPVTSAIRGLFTLAPYKTKGGGFPHPLYLVSSANLRELEGLPLLLVRAACQDPSFQQHHAEGDDGRVDVGLSRDRRVHERIEEGRHSHLPSGVPVMSVPGE